MFGEEVVKQLEKFMLGNLLRRDKFKSDSERRRKAKNQSNKYLHAFMVHIFEIARLADHCNVLVSLMYYWI